MSFYENFVRLCNKAGKSPSAVALEIGIQKPTVTRWSNGSTPRDATLIKVADYFGISTQELIGETKKAPSEDEAIRELAEAMRDRPDVRGLAEVAMANNPDEVAAVTEFLRNLRGGK